MRLITGDELGLLKETIPELCRPQLTNAASSGAPLTPSWSNNTHHRPRPSATSIQSAANSNTSNFNGAVRRLDQHDESNPSGGMHRDVGVVSLSFIDSNKNDTDDDFDASTFQFAALRMDGSIEKWSGIRDSPTNNSEANVTPGRYCKLSSTRNVFTREKMASVEHQEDEISASSNNTKGWYANPPIKPIGMVSSSYNGKYTLAAADSSGNISLLDSDCEVLSRFHAYDNENKDGTVLTYTKGGFANNHVATCIGVGGDKLAVGGRERGVRVLDLETGQGIWKVHTFIVMCFFVLVFVSLFSY